MKCNRCKVDKPELDFGNTVNGRPPHCKKCAEKRKLTDQNKKKGIIPPKILFDMAREKAFKKGNFICSSCKKEKPISEFENIKSNLIAKYQLFGCCATCMKERVRFSKLKSHYGLTKEKYLEIFYEQEGKCRICKTEMDPFQKGNNMFNSLCVDHCHETGKIRGFLCNNCNRALGLFKDNENILLEAYKYIVHFKSDKLLEKPEEVNQQPIITLNE